MPKRDSVVVGLDVGTTKITALVGEVGTGPSDIDIIGVGTAPSTGLRKGVVVNIASTVSAIRQAVEEAEMMAGCEIRSVYTGISGGHIRGFNSHGIVAVQDSEITPADVSRVIDAAKAVAIPMDREVIHILPQEYIVDDQDGIREPLGMNGVRLESKVHIVTASTMSAQNIVKCANRSGLEVEAIVLQQLASADAVLTGDEKDLGVCLVDIGGGTTDIAIFSDGAIVHTSVLPLGGNHLTTDIALGIRTPQDEAEKIKRAHGSATAEQVDPEELVEVPSVGGRQPRSMPKQVLAEIIEARTEEIFQLVGEEIRNTAFEDLLGSGVVLTGGASALRGITELAEDVLGLPVRIGRPVGVGGLNEVVRTAGHATGVGLLRYGAQHLEPNGCTDPMQGIYGRATERLGNWLRAFFTSPLENR
jgi:cell division protein FtsA